MESLQTLRKQVEKETGQDLSWDTAVQLRVIQELIEVSSQVAQLNKVLSDILAESKDARHPISAQEYPDYGSAVAGPSIGTGRTPEGVLGSKQRGRPRKGG